MIKKSTKKDDSSQQDSVSCSKCNKSGQNSVDLDLVDLKKMLVACGGDSIPLHTIHGDVTYHFVTNIYLCPNAIDKGES